MRFCYLDGMKRLGMALLLLLVLGVVLAQAPVPVTRWHADAAVRLPAGAHQVIGEQCGTLARIIGHEDRAEDAACLLWLDTLGGTLYPHLMMNFELAGYEVGAEGALPEPAVGTLTVVFHPQPERYFTLFALYHDSGGMILVTIEE